MSTAAESIPLVSADTDRREILRKEFESAEPYRHIVLDDFLAPDALAEAARAFPDFEWDGWNRYADADQQSKVICSDIEQFPRELADLVNMLNSPQVLHLFQDITGIPSLIPDPYLEGGGLHSSGPGGHLRPHTDFHAYSRLGLFRQVNLLLYLTEGWTPEMGGQLGFFKKSDVKNPVAAVDPLFNRALLFKTDQTSIHGVMPVGANSPVRRSIALYYYTSVDTPGSEGDNLTNWYGPGTGTLQERAREQLFRASVFGMRAFRKAATKLNSRRPQG
jgi:hypothetical protein